MGLETLALSCGMAWPMWDHPAIRGYLQNTFFCPDGRLPPPHPPFILRLVSLPLAQQRSACESWSSLVNSPRAQVRGGREGGWLPSWEGRAAYIGLVTAGLKDELFWLVLPALHRGIGRSQAGRTEGQLGLAGLLL